MIVNRGREQPRPGSPARCGFSAAGPIGVALLAGLLLDGCGKPSPSVAPAETRPANQTKPGEPWFEEVASQAGVNFVFQTGHKPGLYLMPEVKGGGLGLVDYDGDGLDRKSVV